MDHMEANSNKIIMGKDIPFTFEAGGLGKCLFSKMKSGGKAAVQVDGYTGEIDTYEALLLRCIRTAISMSKKGISKGDIISICSYQHFDNIVPLIAAFFIGAIPANLDPEFSVTNTINLIRQIQPKIIFVDSEALELIENCIRESETQTDIVMFGKSEEYMEFTEFTKPLDGENAFEPINSSYEDLAIINFSSGTTGFPKGACLSQWSLLCQSMQYGSNGYLAFSTLYWNVTIRVAIGCIMRTHFRVVVPRFDIDTVWDILSKVKVTAMFVPPFRALLMCKRGRPKNVTTNLKTLVVGGSYVGAHLVSELKNLVPEAEIGVVYGLTEVSGSCIAFMPPSFENSELLKSKPSSIGRVLPGFALKVVDPDTEEVLGPYQEGELRIKSSLQMKCYYNVDSSTAFDSDGWLKTGDILYYDEDNCFYVSDRLKEIIKFQNLKIYPSSIEEVLLSHPSVEAGVVVGRPHPIDRHHLVGIVVLKQNLDDTPTVYDIENYVEERVDKNRRLIGGVKLIQSMPLTPNGKVNRQFIKEMVMNENV